MPDTRVSTSGTPLLRASGLTRRFGGLAAVNGVALDLHVGEVHAVIGTNGAGKSTLINLLSGELPTSSGLIEFDGRDVTRWAQAPRARAGIGRSYQRTTVFPEFSTLENARLCAQAAYAKPWAFWQRAQGCADSLALARAALESAGLSELATQRSGALSHGAQRQLEIAMCLATQPRVLLLDEPLAGMGAEENDRMLTPRARLKSTHAILLVEHDMDAVFRIADRITVMVNGTVIATGDPTSIRENP